MWHLPPATLLAAPPVLCTGRALVCSEVPMSKRRSAKSKHPVTPVKPAPPRSPLPGTSRSYGKVAGDKGSMPPVPRDFSHRKRG